MKRFLRRLGVLLVLGLLAYGGFLVYRWRTPAAAPALDAAEAGRLLVNRNWLDVMPRDEKERLHVYRFTPAMGGGVFQDRTLFKGEFELFTFKVNGDQLEIHLPHQRQRVVTHYEIRRVDHKPFDLELTIDPDPRGPKKYYGFSSERAEEADVQTLVTNRR